MSYLIYEGDWLLRALYVRSRICNSILNFTGSQWREATTGVTWSLLLCQHFGPAGGRLWLWGRAVILQPKGRQFDPQFPHLHAEVSLGKILNPQLPLMKQKSAANRCTVWMCVWMCEWQTTVKRFEWSSRLEKKTNKPFSQTYWDVLIIQNYSNPV